MPRVTTLGNGRPSAERDARAFAALFPAVYLRFHRRKDPRKLRISSQMWAVLQHLAMSGPLTVGEAAAHFDRAQSVMSAIATALERKRLVERMRDPADRRRALVWLTPEGQELLAREREVLDEEKLVDAMRRLAPATRTALLRGMKELAAAQREPPERNPDKTTHEERRP